MKLTHFSARSCPVPHFTYSEEIFSRQSDNGVAMARKLARHKPDRKLVGNLQRKDGKARLFDEKRQDDEEVKKICQNLVESMPKRIREVIKNKGGHITY